MGLKFLCSTEVREMTLGSTQRVVKKGQRNRRFEKLDFSFQIRHLRVLINAISELYVAGRGRHPLIASIVCWMVLRFQVDLGLDQQIVTTAS